MRQLAKACSWQKCAGDTPPKLVGTKYFHSLQKRNRGRNVLKSLYVNDRSQQGEKTLTNTTNEMLTEANYFFGNLYRKKPAADGIEAFTEGISHLSELHSEICERPLEMEDLSFSVFSMRNNTSPGPSGYTGEFYKLFWPELKHLALDACNEIFERGEMSIALKRSVTILIPKKDKDTRMIHEETPFHEERIYLNPKLIGRD